MFAGINTCLSSDLVNYVGTHDLCWRVFIFCDLKMVANFCQISPLQTLMNLQ